MAPPGHAWRLRLFGEVEAARGEERVTRFGSRKHAALLALLALRPGRVVARDVLMEALWPEVDPARGGNRLAVAVSALRGVLEAEPGSRGTVIEAGRGGIALAVGVGSDVAELEQALAWARRAEGEERREALRRVVAAGEGSLLPGYDEGWIPEARVRLEAAWSGAAGELAERLAAEPGDEGVDLLLRLVARAPERPELAVRLLDGLTRAGRGAEALSHGRAWALAWGRATGGRRLPAPVAERLERLGAGGVAGVGVRLGSASGGPAATTAERASVAGPAAAPAQAAAPAGGRLVAHLLAELGGEPVAEGVEVRGAGGRWRLLASAARPLLGLLAELLTRDPSARAAIDALEPGSSPLDDLAAALVDATPPGTVVATALAAAWLERHGRERAGAPGGEPRAEAAGLVDLGRFELAGRAERVGWWRLRADAPLPELRARPARLGRLPASATRFFGREPEIEALLDELDEGARLLTLLGPGGAGKTRLALEAARRAVGTGRVEEAAFASLADVGEPEAAALAVLDAFGLRLDAAPLPARLSAALGERPTLLLLDNAELVAPSLGPLLAGLLAEVPALRLLVTSQRPLGLAAERRLPLPPLPLPEEGAEVEALRGSPAVALFLDRARAGRPDFTLNPSNAPAVGRLCRLLGGHPLALELAASRAATLSPQRLLQQLEEGALALATRQADRPARHRSLAAALDGNLSLVDPPLRRTWARLVVLPADFPVEAAEQVRGAVDAGASPVEDELAELCDASLLGVDTSGDEPRYHLPQGLRTHALAGLEPAERAEAAARWVGWIEGLGRAARAQDGRFDPAAHRVLAREWAHVRAAMAQAEDRGLALVRPLLPHVVWAGREREVLRQLTPLLDQPTLALPAARELLDLASRVGEAGVVDRCLAVFAAHEQDPVVLLNSAAQRASAEGRAATAAASFLRLHDALPPTKRSLRAAARMNHARSLDELGRVGEAGAARAALRAELDPARDGYVLSTLFVYEAIAALWAGEPARAAAAVAAGDALFPVGEAPAWWVAADISRAHAALLGGDAAGARARLVPLVARFRAEQNERVGAFAEQTLGFVALAEGAFAEAESLGASTAEVFERLGMSPELQRSLLLRARAAAGRGDGAAEDRHLLAAARLQGGLDVVWGLGWLVAALGRRELERGDTRLGRRLLAAAPRGFGPEGAPVPAFDAPLVAALAEGIGPAPPAGESPRRLVDRWLGHVGAVARNVAA